MKKVDKAFDKLNSKGYRSSINWSPSKESGVFSIQNEVRGKELNGVLSIKNQNIEIDVAVSNYNAQYAREMLKTTFQQEGILRVSILLKPPVERNTILVGNNMCNGLQPGQEIMLSAMTMYFAKNSHYVNCNGDFLGADFLARFNSQIHARCPGGDDQKFCEFLLITRMS